MTLFSVIPGRLVEPDPEPMHTDGDKDVLAPEETRRRPVFMGSGFAAAPRPGMTA